MLVNGKDYSFEIRTKEENNAFLELLSEAEDKLNQALYMITYMGFGSINESTKNTIKNIIGNISRVEYGISGEYDNLYKPVRNDK